MENFKHQQVKGVCREEMEFYVHSSEITPVTAYFVHPILLTITTLPLSPWITRSLTKVPCIVASISP